MLIRKELVGLEVDQLKQTMEWHALPQRFIDQSIGEWRRRLQCVVDENGGHIEHNVLLTICTTAL